MDDGLLGSVVGSAFDDNSVVGRSALDVFGDFLDDTAEFLAPSGTIGIEGPGDILRHTVGVGVDAAGVGDAAKRDFVSAVSQHRDSEDHEHIINDMSDAEADDDEKTSKKQDARATDHGYEEGDESSSAKRRDDISNNLIWGTVASLTGAAAAPDSASAANNNNNTNSVVSDGRVWGTAVSDLPTIHEDDEDEA